MKSIFLRGFVFLLISMSSLTGCSDDAQQIEDCPITIDSVSIVDSVDVGNKVYYLVHRVAGWSDKTEILELYDSKPVFDKCARSNIEPIYGDSLEQDTKISHVYLNTQDGVLDIEYADPTGDQANDQLNPSVFRLEIK